MILIKKLISLHGRRALVTGATGHLGTIICETLAQLGSELILLDKDQIRLTNLQKKLRNKYKIKAYFFACDLQYEQQRQHVINSLLSNNKALSILINNAAFVGTSRLSGWAVPFQKQKLSTWKNALEVNLTAVFHLTQGLVPLLKKGKNSNILNISSIYASLGPNWSLYKDTRLGNPAAYGVSKSGIDQLTRWLATTLAPKIRVNAISPGGILRQQPSKFINRYKKLVPFGRMATENDIQGAIVYLVSDLAKYTTGENIVIDGGFSKQ